MVGAGSKPALEVNVLGQVSLRLWLCGTFL